jgi:hypothetical protein
VLSCSARLDWEFATRRSLNRATLLLAAAIGILLLLLVTFVRMAGLHESFMDAFYWAAAYAAHREPEPKPDSEQLKALTLVWIALSETYWAAIIGVAVTWIGDFFEK